MSLGYQAPEQSVPGGDEVYSCTEAECESMSVLSSDRHRTTRWAAAPNRAVGIIARRAKEDAGSRSVDEMFARMLSVMGLSVGQATESCIFSYSEVSSIDS